VSTFQTSRNQHQGRQSPARFRPPGRLANGYLPEAVSFHEMTVEPKKVKKIQVRELQCKFYDSCYERAATGSTVFNCHSCERYEKLIDNTRRKAAAR
jgi:hypothetical protein